MVPAGSRSPLRMCLRARGPGIRRDFGAVDEAKQASEGEPQATPRKWKETRRELEERESDSSRVVGYGRNNTTHTHLKRGQSRSKQRSSQPCQLFFFPREK